MLTQNVNKTDDISGIANNTFIYCKELRKGFVKVDLTPLSLSNTSFEFVLGVIEAMGTAVINSDFDSILFGANLSDNQGQIEKSTRLEETIRESIKDMTTSERDIYITNKKLDRRYFDATMIMELVGNSIVKKVVFTNFVEPKRYTFLAWFFNTGSDINGRLPSSSYEVVAGLTYTTDNKKNYTTSYKDAYHNPRTGDIEIVFNTPQPLTYLEIQSSSWYYNNGTEAVDVLFYDTNDNLLTTLELRNLFSGTSGGSQNMSILYSFGDNNAPFSIS